MIHAETPISRSTAPKATWLVLALVLTILAAGCAQAGTSHGRSSWFSRDFVVTSPAPITCQARQVELPDEYRDLGYVALLAVQFTNVSSEPRTLMTYPGLSNGMLVRVITRDGQLVGTCYGGSARFINMLLGPNEKGVIPVPLTKTTMYLNDASVEPVELHGKHDLVVLYCPYFDVYVPAQHIVTYPYVSRDGRFYEGLCVSDWTTVDFGP